jgi:hypothetical protein
MKPHISKYHPSKTIDDVLEQLDQIVEQSISSDNYLCAFAYVYRKTTAEIKLAIEEGRFEDPKRMERMDVAFANYYLKAYFDFQAGEPVSSSWKFAFELKDKQLSLIQHILFGMNAHINLDLCVAAVNITDRETILDLKHDFMVVNKILASLTNRMQKGIGRSSVFMKILDVFGFRSDEKIINFSIKRARDFAWLNAIELALLNEGSRKARISEIDVRVVEISKMVLNPPGKLLDLILKFISLFEAKNKQKIVNALERI